MIFGIGRLLVDEHDRDIVFDTIDMTARFAGQLLAGFVMDQITMAFRTTEYVEELFRNHDRFLAMI